jgi:hypothetical protein
MCYSRFDENACIFQPQLWQMTWPKRERITDTAVSLQREITPNNYQPGAETTARNWYKLAKQPMFSRLRYIITGLTGVQSKIETPVVAVAIFQGIGHWPLKTIQRNLQGIILKMCRNRISKDPTKNSSSFPRHLVYLHLCIYNIYILYFTQYIYICI